MLAADADEMRQLDTADLQIVNLTVGDRYGFSVIVNENEGGNRLGTKIQFRT